MKWFKGLTWPNKIALVVVVLVGLVYLLSSGRQQAGGPAPAATATTGVAPAAPATPATVAPPAPKYGAKDLPAIMDASQTNEARFNRDYRGASFAAAGRFTSLQEMLGMQQVSVQVGEYEIICTGGIGDKTLAKKAIDWRAGDRVTITGTIDETTLGVSLSLDDCDASK